jgi:uncharacterized protein YggU (UPF0235/DUF167 family)
VKARVAVRVTPRAKHVGIRNTPEGVRVNVAEVPADGEANLAVIEALARSLQVPKSNVTIIRGHTSRDKVLEIEGIDEARLESWRNSLPI